MYLGMEYVGGPDLQAAIGGTGRSRSPTRSGSWRQLAAALSLRARSRHRPPRPQAGERHARRRRSRHAPKIIDFGLAKLAADQGLTRLTEDSELVGSPLYWAPEQSATSGGRAGGRHLRARRASRTSCSPASRCSRPRPAVAMVYAHVHEAPPSPRGPRAGHRASGRARDLVGACVAKAPADRPSPRSWWPSSGRCSRGAGRLSRANRPEAHVDRGASDGHEEAMAAQVRQVRARARRTASRSRRKLPIRSQNELSELELELAMLDAETDDVDCVRTLTAAGRARSPSCAGATKGRFRPSPTRYSRTGPPLRRRPSRCTASSRRCSHATDADDDDQTPVQPAADDDRSAVAGACSHSPDLGRRGSARPGRQDRAVRADPRARARRHGPGVPRARYPARPPRRDEVPDLELAEVHQAIPGRGASDRAVRSREHRGDPRRRGGRGPALHGARVRRGHDASRA